MNSKLLNNFLLEVLTYVFIFCQNYSKFLDGLTLNGKDDQKRKIGILSCIFREVPLCIWRFQAIAILYIRMRAIDTSAYKSRKVKFFIFNLRFLSFYCCNSLTLGHTKINGVCCEFSKLSIELHFAL